VYTGDFNATADGHLGAAAIPGLRPHLLIIESTYGSSVPGGGKGEGGKIWRGEG
jgi:integrator complex subunit 11